MSGDHDNPPAAAREPRRDSPQPPRSRGEKIFLAALISVTLLTAIIFLAMTAWGMFIPAMGIAILTATGVATLVYAFLGGRGDDSFQIRGMQLAGAAAVFAVIVYIVNGSLDGQMNKLELIEKSRTAKTQIEAAENRAETAEAARVRAERTLRLRGQSGERDLLDEIRRATPNSELGKAINALSRAGDGPFARLVGSADIVARFNGRIAESGFEYCHSTLPQFRDMVVRFRPADPDATGEILLTPGADIGPQCGRAGMTHTVKLGCDAARALIPNLIEGCTAQDGVLWREGANRGEFTLPAIIENPDRAPSR